MVAQEKEYMGDLVSRVAALRPHLLLTYLLLVGRTATRLPRLLEQHERCSSAERQAWRDPARCPYRYSIWIVHD